MAGPLSLPVCVFHQSGGFLNSQEGQTKRSNVKKILNWNKVDWTSILKELDLTFSRTSLFRGNLNLGNLSFGQEPMCSSFGPLCFRYLCRRDTSILGKPQFRELKLWSGAHVLLLWSPLFPLPLSKGHLYSGETSI